MAAYGNKTLHVVPRLATGRKNVARLIANLHALTLELIIQNRGCGGLLDLQTCEQG